MRFSHRVEGALLHGLLGGVRSMSWRPSLGAGALLGDLARTLAVRRGVAESNLARAFPERSATERGAILAGHYRELGRVVMEYARLPELARAEGDEFVAGASGLEHLERAHTAGRGMILLTGHFGNFELLGAWLGRTYPVDFVVQPFSNPLATAELARLRERAGVGQIPRGAALRRVFEALRANRCVAMLADQDARRSGVFVPFFGIPSSTPVGPAELALRTGAPIVMGFDRRRADGRHELIVEAPIELPDRRSPDAAVRVTAAHAARLEQRIRANPELWFWLHRRWKTSPPALRPERRSA